MQSLSGHAVIIEIVILWADTNFNHRLRQKKGRIRKCVVGYAGGGADSLASTYYQEVPERSLSA